MMAKIMKEPELASAMQKPKVMQAIMVRWRFRRENSFKLFSSFFFRGREREREREKEREG